MLTTQIENPENKENQANNIISLAKNKPSTHRNNTNNKIVKKTKTKSLIVPKKQIKKDSTDKGITSQKKDLHVKHKERIQIEKHYFHQENILLFSNYGDAMFNYLKKIEVNIPSTLLKQHPITSTIHLKMIDWMIEVLSVYQSSNETFYLGIKIMDLYIHKAQNLKSSNIHLIGMTSMFIASKYEDVYPISLNIFVKKIGHNQFSQ